MLALINEREHYVISTNRTQKKEAKTMDAYLLIQLATKIDEARIVANVIPEAAPQSGVYGQLSSALIATLTLIAGERRANIAYNCILDGDTVEQAIKQAAKVTS